MPAAVRTSTVTMRCWNAWHSMAFHYETTCKSHIMRMRLNAHVRLGADPRLDSSINVGTSGLGELLRLPVVRICCPAYLVSGAMIVLLLSALLPLTGYETTSELCFFRHAVAKVGSS